MAVPSRVLPHAFPTAEEDQVAEFALDLAPRERERTLEADFKLLCLKRDDRTRYTKNKKLSDPVNFSPLLGINLLHFTQLKSIHHVLCTRKQLSYALILSNQRNLNSKSIKEAAISSPHIVSTIMSGQRLPPRKTRSMFSEVLTLDDDNSGVVYRRRHGQRPGISPLGSLIRLSTYLSMASFSLNISLGDCKFVRHDG